MEMKIFEMVNRFFGNFVHFIIFTVIKVLCLTMTAGSNGYLNRLNLLPLLLTCRNRFLDLRNTSDLCDGLAIHEGCN
jgi:hypothetical protein